MEFAMRLTESNAEAELKKLRLEIAELAAVVEPDSDVELRLAGACERAARLLEKEDRFPEATQAWQEATDSYGRAGREKDVRRCALHALHAVRYLWQRPEERIYLLIARMERTQRQIAQEPASEARQAECVLQIATVFQRRGRFVEAEERCREALTLSEKAAETGMQQAECHERLGGLYHYELYSPERAIRHYRRAIALYGQHELYLDGEQIGRLHCEDLLAALLSKHDREQS